MSAMNPVGKTDKTPGERPARTTPRVHPSWLGTLSSPGSAPSPGRIDVPTLQKLWEAVDGQ
ncbi:MAG: hypothetical protein ACRYG4_09865 [Janthinobacterium lividum]